jgi:ATP-dependent DNA helicase DinG
MRGELVAVDLETTGLDLESDAIIEFAAVRIRDGQIVDEYATLINPGRPLPPFITELTGIRDEDFLPPPRGADEPLAPRIPYMAGAVPAIRGMVGESNVIAHNITFDRGFLNREGLLQSNLWLDTHDLAFMLYPHLPRYSLDNLTQHFQIDLKGHHRALADARATALLYWRLWERAMELPHAILREISAATEGLDWSTGAFFRAAAEEQTTSGRQPALRYADILQVFQREPAPEPLQPATASGKITEADLTAIFGTQGALAQGLSAYEDRPGQLQMAQAVAESFNHNQHYLIEAGTGTGKSAAYLAPAALWAARSGERVIISTQTINLQEQLLQNDVPIMQKATGIPFRTALLKGRGNYLCPRRLNALRQRKPTSADEIRILGKLLIWLNEDASGDRGRITLRGPVENGLWNRLSAEDDDCTLERCGIEMAGVCPFYKARVAAESAHVVIVNHALLVSDAAAENRILPEYHRLIVDEAHHLEDAVTNGLGFRLDEITLRSLFSDIGSTKRGLMGELLTRLQSHISDSEWKKIANGVKHISSAITVAEAHARDLFARARQWHLEALKGDLGASLRLTTQTRQGARFGATVEAWHSLHEVIQALDEVGSRLIAKVRDLDFRRTSDIDEVLGSLQAAQRSLTTVDTRIAEIFDSPDPNTIYWISANYRETVVLNGAPLEVGDLVEGHLWRKVDSVVLTSATLQTNAGFDYVQKRLQTDTFQTLDVGTPFDYRRSALIFIPSDMPDPSDRDRYQQAVERGIIELAAALEGRVLALFTSYTQLQQTAQAIRPRLALGNISIYDQSDGTSRQALLDGFKTTERAVLMGTKSFWEGVDIPGEALSAVVIVKLPFAVPTDPIVASRAEQYADSFSDYMVPDAILRFRQGFGRLIRTRTDRGIVAIFDRRIISKGYGSKFLGALPNCEVEKSPLDTLPQVAKRWLAQRKG